MRIYQKRRKCRRSRKGLYAKKILTIYLIFVLALTSHVTVLASGDPLAVVNNLSEFIFGLIRAIGMILLGFGIVQIGLSLKSHDPSQRANGFLTLAGGVIITFAREILTMIAG
nr:glutamyl-tRNA amidotransferase [uncultured Merdimonas sp.]